MLEFDLNSISKGRLVPLHPSCLNTVMPKQPWSMLQKCQAVLHPRVLYKHKAG